jgi:hypothetical protein
MQDGAVARMLKAPDSIEYQAQLRLRVLMKANRAEGVAFGRLAAQDFVGGGFLQKVEKFEMARPKTQHLVVDTDDRSNVALETSTPKIIDNLTKDISKPFGWLTHFYRSPLLDLA